jgi:hypothetical protein
LNTEAFGGMMRRDWHKSFTLRDFRMTKGATRVIPKVLVADGKVLTLKELSRAKDSPIQRSDDCFRRWIQRGVQIGAVIVHLPHLDLGYGLASSVHALRAFLNTVQDISHANTAMLADSLGPPVIVMKGDIFKGMK